MTLWYKLIATDWVLVFLFAMLALRPRVPDWVPAAVYACFAFMAGLVLWKVWTL
jgi:hypothetical protein